MVDEDVEDTVRIVSITDIMAHVAKETSSSVGREHRKMVQRGSTSIVDFAVTAVLHLGSSMDGCLSSGNSIVNGKARTIVGNFVAMVTPFIIKKPRILDAGSWAYVRIFVSPPNKAP